MKDTSSPLLSRGRRHSGGPCSTSASTRPGSLAGVLSASHIDHLRTSSDPITRLKSPLETFGEGGGRAGASVYNSPSPSSASSGSDLRSRQQLLRHVGSGEGERDVLTRTPTTSKRRTRPPGGEGRRRSVPSLTQHQTFIAAASSPTSTSSSTGSPQLLSRTGGGPASANGGGGVTTRLHGCATVTETSLFRAQPPPLHHRSCSSVSSEGVFGQALQTPVGYHSLSGSARSIHSNSSSAKQSGLGEAICAQSTDSPTTSVVSIPFLQRSVSTGLFAQRRQHQQLETQLLLSAARSSPVIARAVSDRQLLTPTSNNNKTYGDLVNASDTPLEKNLVGGSLSWSCNGTSVDLGSGPLTTHRRGPGTGTHTPRASASCTTPECQTRERQNYQSAGPGVGVVTSSANGAHHLDAERETLCRAVEQHNQRRQLDIFKITLSEGLHYEGALRFYYTSQQGQETAKVVRVQNTTTARDLVSLLLPKFATCIDPSLLNNPSQFSIAIVDQEGQHQLDDSEFPLQVSFRSAALAPLRFLLRHQSVPASSVDSDSAGCSADHLRHAGHHSPGTATSAECVDAPLKSSHDIARSQDSVANMSTSPTPYLSTHTSLSQTSINIESDSSTSLEHHPSTADSPVTLQSPVHNVTPRRIIRTLKRMRRSSSGNPRSSWHEDDRRRSSTANSLRIYAGPALQEQSASDYKTVFAVDDTTTREVIESALQRLFIDDASCDDYVLCETIGVVEPYHCVSGEVIGYNNANEVDWSNVAHRFMPQYSRLLASNEHPQVLMRLWYAESSSERRLYLHPRAAVPQYRLGAPASPPTSPLSSTTTDESAPTPQLTFVQRYCDTPSKLLVSGIQGDQLRTPFLVTLSCSAPEKNLLVYPLIDKVTSIGQSSTPSLPSAGLSIALSGNDLLPFHCSIRCTEFRRSSTSLNKAHERRDIFSLDPCSGAAVAVNGVPCHSLVPLHDGDLIHLAMSHVFLFRDPAEPVPLSNGWKWLPQPKYPDSLEVSAGSPPPGSYSETPTAMSTHRTSSSSIRELSTSPRPRQVPDNLPSVIVSAEGTTSPMPTESLTKTMQFAFMSTEEEDSFIQLVVTSHRVSSLSMPLSPAAAISLALLQFDPVERRHPAIPVATMRSGLKRFLSKVCEALQGVVWQTAAILDSHKAYLTGGSDPLHVLSLMTRDLNELAAWTANVLEVINSVRLLLRRYEVASPPLSSVSEPAPDSELSELTTSLQEIAVYAFQQILYPVTKLLYMVLPAILDENPFEFMHCSRGDSSDSRSRGVLGGSTSSPSTSDSALGRSYSGSDRSYASDGDPSSPREALPDAITATAPSSSDRKTTSPQKESQVRNLTDILQIVLDTLARSQLHPNLILQLLSNVFFFTNASLFNTLMDEGAGDRFYRWNKGIQIRTNLDLLETWAAQEGVTKEAIRHLQQLSAAADLLALPKQTLLQTSWSQLRSEHKSLTPAQLHRLLQNYQVGINQKRPVAWSPLTSELASARDVDDVLVSFASHPPLRIPTGNFVFRLNSIPPSSGIVRFVEDVFATMKSLGLAVTMLRSSSLSSSSMSSLPDKTDVRHHSLIDGETSAVSALETTPTAVANGHGYTSSDEAQGATHPSTLAQQNHDAAKEGNGAAKVVTALDDFSVDEADSASHGLAVIAEDDEEDGTPLVSRKGHRRVNVASDLTTSAHLEYTSSSTATVATIQIPTDPSSMRSLSPAATGSQSMGALHDSTSPSPSSIGYSAVHLSPSGSTMTASYSASKSKLSTSSDTRSPSPTSSTSSSRNRMTSPPSSNSTTPTSTLNRSMSLSTQNLHSELVDRNSTDEFIVVNLKKSESGSVGLGFIDGALMGASPGLYITALVPGLPAAESGKLQEGDKVLAINSCNLSRASQTQAYEVLKSAGRRVTVLALRDTAAANLIVASSC